MTREEITKMMVNASSVVKLVCGIGNNAAWLVALDGLDHARQCHRYSGRVKYLFKRCIQMFHDYERRLIYATDNRMFHLADMTPDIRRQYGDITDRQYYEMWTATGTDAYVRTRPLQTSLWNKYRVSLVRHGVNDAAHVAWVMTAMAALELSVSLYKEAVKDCHKGIHIPMDVMEHVFGQFSLAPISKTWMNALIALAPETEGYELEHFEEMNIEQGLRQLQEAWIDTDLIFDSTMSAVEQYGEVFRTKGFQKRAMRHIADVKAETNAQL